MKRHIWTAEEIAVLSESYPNQRTDAIAAAMNCSMSRVYNKAHSLGLKKSEEYLQSEDSGRTNGERGGVTRFKKGQVAWNKGVSFHSGGRSVETQFKSGQQPHTTLPVGTYRLNKDDVLQRKVSDKAGNASQRWRGVHELVWIEANGAVPEKHIVIFKKGMRTNVLEEITIDKVECVSFAENMQRNTRHNYPPEINELIHARAVLTRQINKRAKNERPENNQ